eukprot:Lankesteria_metandrocarpae@DN5403_c0_g3_i3.p1
MMMTNNKFAVGVVAVLSFAVHAVVGQVSYNYNSHGSDWTGTCSTGKKQSPVDLPATTATLSDFNSSVSLIGLMDDFQISQTGHSIRIIPSGEALYTISTISTSDPVKVYSLVSYVFHAMSEHTIAGDRKAMEAEFQFTNIGDVKDALTMSFLFDSVATADAQALPGMTLLSNAGLTTGVSTITSEDKNYDMLDRFLKLTRDDNKSALLTYEGSLTSPPCTESIRWLVWTTPLKLDSAVYTRIYDALKFTGATDGNYREVQTQDPVVVPTLTFATTEASTGDAVSVKTFSVVVVAALLTYLM